MIARRGDDKGKKDPVPLEFVAAEVARPLAARLPLTIEFSGPLVAPRTAIVRAKAAGTLLSLGVAEGSRVKAGQVIGVIDLADLQSRAADRAALVESAQATLIEAERQHTANVGLAAQNFISPTALQTSQARLDAARAQLKSAEAQLASMRVGIREATLAVPISGIVGKRHVVPGEKVSAEQPIVTVVDLATLELAGAVGTHEVSLLQPGQAVAVRIEGQDRDVAGRIDRIAPAAEAGTRAIGVVVVLENPGERFRAGQYAQARVELADPAERMTVPAGALGQASGQDFVWTIEKGALVRRIVVTGRRDPASGRVEVVQGPRRRCADPRHALRQPEGRRAGPRRRAPRDRRRRRQRVFGAGRPVDRRVGVGAGAAALTRAPRARAMWFTRVSIANPVFATMVMAALCVLGLFSYSQLRVERLPDITPPIVFVSVAYPGASPEAIETELTRPIELSLNGIAGVKMIRSNSLEGRSETVVEFQVSADMNRAVQDVRDKVAVVQPSFPRDAKQPYVSRFDGDNAQPTVYLSLLGRERSSRELSLLADQVVRKRLERASGVARVDVGGLTRAPGPDRPRSAAAARAPAHAGRRLDGAAARQRRHAGRPAERHARKTRSSASRAR